MPTSYDIVVVGGGSGGLAAAHTAIYRGASVCIVQDGPIGGDCTWTGCVPSKALLAASASGQSFTEAMAATRSAIEQVAAGETADILRSHGIDVIDGRAHIGGGGSVDVGGEQLKAKKLIVSPGSQPARPPIPGLGDVGALTNKEIFVMDKLPGSLIIVGGGPIGCEMAQSFAALGSAVTVLEGEDRVLPRDDPAASAVACDALVGSGVDVRTGGFVKSVSRVSGVVEVSLADGSVVSGEEILVATGRAPANAGMGLEDAGVRFDDRGWIEVDRTLRTSAKDIYAIGDAIGSTQFTHAAAHMGRLAVENALGAGYAKFRKLRFDPGEIPWVTFMSPEVGQVGVTEAAAESIKGARVAELPLYEVDRAVATHRTAGFIKLIAKPRPVIGFAGGGRLIGATIVAPAAGELIGEAALAIRTGMFAGRLAQTVHPYPSWSFGLQTAAAQFMGTFNGRTARAPGQGAERLVHQ